MLRYADAPGTARSARPPEEETQDFSEIAGAVVEAAKGLRYGSIEVVVHEGRVVQIVRTEKRRVLR
jgi:hypothetical protein